MGAASSAAETFESVTCADLAPLQWNGNSEPVVALFSPKITDSAQLSPHRVVVTSTCLLLFTEDSTPASYGLDAIFEKGERICGAVTRSDKHKTHKIFLVTNYGSLLQWDTFSRKVDERSTKQLFSEKRMRGDSDVKVRGRRRKVSFSNIMDFSHEGDSEQSVTAAVPFGENCVVCGFSSGNVVAYSLTTGSEEVRLIDVSKETAAFLIALPVQQLLVAGLCVLISYRESSDLIEVDVANRCAKRRWELLDLGAMGPVIDMTFISQERIVAVLTAATLTLCVLNPQAFGQSAAEADSETAVPRNTAENCDCITLRLNLLCPRDERLRDLGKATCLASSSRAHTVFVLFEIGAIAVLSLENATCEGPRRLGPAFIARNGAPVIGKASHKDCATTTVSAVSYKRLLVLVRSLSPRLLKTLRVCVEADLPVPSFTNAKRLAVYHCFDKHLLKNNSAVTIPDLCALQPRHAFVKMAVEPQSEALLVAFMPLLPPGPIPEVKLRVIANIFGLQATSNVPARMKGASGHSSQHPERAIYAPQGGRAALFEEAGNEEDDFIPFIYVPVE